MCDALHPNLPHDREIIGDSDQPFYFTSRTYATKATAAAPVRAYGCSRQPNLKCMDEIKDLLSELCRLTLIASKDVLTIKEAATYLGISEATLRSHIGEFRRFQPTGKQVYIRKDELDRWMQQNPIPSDKDIERAADIHLSNQFPPKCKKASR